MYGSFLAQVNSDYNVDMEEIPHSPNYSSLVEQVYYYNYEGILAETPCLETIIHVLTQTTAYPLL